ncbi:MAG: YgdI/YgdR family lipoprotein [Thermodesulfobacteriota bacterium]
MKNKLFVLFLTLFMMLLLTACGSYYMVKDPSSGKTYYTQDIKDKKEGAVQFKDAATGSEVTIQNSEVTEIEKEVFLIKTTPEPETKTE